MPQNESPEELRRQGKLLILGRDVELPARCFTCNESAPNQRTKTLRWHTPWLYLAIVGGVLPYLLLAVLFSKRRQLTVHYCDEHLSKRRIGLAVNWTLFVGGVGILFAGPATAALAGLLMVAVSMVQAVRLSSRNVRATYIGEGFARLTGCGDPYLRSLEQSRQAPVRDHGLDWSSAAPLPAPVQTKIPLAR